MQIYKVVPSINIIEFYNKVPQSELRPKFIKKSWYGDQDTKDLTYLSSMENTCHVNMGLIFLEILGFTTTIYKLKGTKFNVIFLTKTTSKIKFYVCFKMTLIEGFNVDFSETNVINKVLTPVPLITTIKPTFLDTT